jgi:hypothetical protein
MHLPSQKDAAGYERQHFEFLAIISDSYAIFGSGGPLHRQTHYFRSPILVSPGSVADPVAPS